MTICVSVGEPTASASARLLRRAGLAEVRLDLIRDAADHLPLLFAGPGRRIATCRPGRLAPRSRRDLLLAALGAGASMVDLEHDAPASIAGPVLGRARREGRQILVSFHEPRRTPPRRELERVLRRGFARGADLVKLACRIHRPEDCARLLGLIEPGGRVLVAGLGDEGRAVRILAPLLGAPFTYAAAPGGRSTAPGQMDSRALGRALAAAARLLEVDWSP